MPILLDLPLAAALPLVSVLGIDETRRGKPIWAQDPSTKRWVLVADRFHLVHLANDMLTQVRQRISQEPVTRRVNHAKVTVR